MKGIRLELLMSDSWWQMQTRIDWQVVFFCLSFAKQRVLNIDCVKRA